MVMMKKMMHQQKMKDLKNFEWIQSRVDSNWMKQMNEDRLGFWMKHRCVVSCYQKENYCGAWLNNNEAMRRMERMIGVRGLNGCGWSEKTVNHIGEKQIQAMKLGSMKEKLESVSKKKVHIVM